MYILILLLLRFEVCEITFEEVRRAHFICNNEDFELCNFSPCWCNETQCSKFKLADIPTDAINITVLKDAFDKSLANVKSTVTKEMIDQMDYFCKHFQTRPEEKPDYKQKDSHDKKYGCEFVVLAIFSFVIVYIIIHYSF